MSDLTAFQENINSKIITFDYTYQVPINEMAIDFGHNSSLGFNYLTNNNNLLIGLDANFMFGNNVKNDRKSDRKRFQT